MRASFSLAVFFGLVYLASGVDTACAQEQIAAPGNAAPGDDNAAPPAAAPNTNPQNGAAQQQRNSQRRAQNEVRLRSLMQDMGIEAVESQDAVVAYLAEDETGKMAARGAARRLMLAVRADTTPNRMRELLAIYKAALDADRERRRAAQSALDAKIGFSLNPRLEATLWLLGVLGDGQNGPPPNMFLPRAPRTAPDDKAPRGGDWRGDNRRGGDNNPRGDGPPAANDNQGGDNPRWGNPRDGRGPEMGMAGMKRGTTRGFVTGKTENWIELRGDDGKIERFWPLWTGGEARPGTIPNVPPALATPQNPADGKVADADIRFGAEILKTLAQIEIGSLVRLDWQGSERKRVVSLDILQPQNPPQETP